MFKRTRSFIKRLTSGECVDAVERRGSERYYSERQIKIRPEDGALPIIARIQDVSRGGIRLVVDRPIEAGSMIHVELPVFGSNPHTTILACVVYCKAGDGDTFVIGCSFSTDLNDVDLGILGAKERPPQGSRASPRIDQVGGGVNFRLAEQGEFRRAVAIHNISLGGIAVKLTEEIEPGAILELQLVDAAGVTRKTMAACVVYVADADEGQWLLGCNFVGDLDDEDLRALIGPAR